MPMKGVGPRRHDTTCQLVKAYINPYARILDLGYSNDLSLKIKNMGFDVTNTDFDLDLEPEKLQELDYDVVTSFEVFEHLVNPFSVLENIKPDKFIICSVPIRVWFKKPHWIEDSPLRQHYHEFLPREFYKLLTKAGYTIRWAEKRCIVEKLGIRPLLTWLFRIKRYLFVYAIKE
jgi:hypothetical protein